MEAGVGSGELVNQQRGPGCGEVGVLSQGPHPEETERWKQSSLLCPDRITGLEAEWTPSWASRLLLYLYQSENVASKYVSQITT